MSQPTLHLSGLSRSDEAAFKELLEKAQAQLQPRWTLTSQDQAAAILIDTDSMYGQMGLMQALSSGKCLIALTEGARADTDHLLRKPVTLASLVAMLNGISAETLLPQEPPAPAFATSVGQAPVRIPEPVIPEMTAVAAPIEIAEPVIADFNPEPVAAVIPQETATPAVDLNLNVRYKLERWPQIDRGYPKHFRIATLMLKGAATPAEIAEATGATVSEVAEFIVAKLASGHAVRA